MRSVARIVGIVFALAAAMLAAGPVAADGERDFSPPDRLRVLEVDAGVSHYCALRADRTLTCWRTEDVGYEGEADSPKGEFLTVSAGGNSSCAIRTNGTLYCWADPEVSPPTGTFSAVSGECGIRTSGTLDCWGYHEQPDTSTARAMDSGATGYPYWFVSCRAHLGSGDAAAAAADPVLSRFRVAARRASSMRAGSARRGMVRG
jgi:hypothetical protein